MIVGVRGKPQMIVSDNCAEFTSNAMLVWRRIMVSWHHIAPGRPKQNGYIESSTAAYATSFSTRAGSSISVRLAGAAPPGSPTTNCEAAFLAGLQDAGRLCRYTHRAEVRNIGRGCNRRWMKVQCRSCPTRPSGRSHSCPELSRRDSVTFQIDDPD